MSDLITIEMITRSITEASRILPIIWPLKSSIAINPLWDLTHKPFNEALEQVRAYLPIKGFLSNAEYIELYKNEKISDSALKKALTENTSLSCDEANHIISKFITGSLQGDNSKDIKPALSFPKKIKDEIILFFSRHFDQSTPQHLENTLFPLWEDFKQKKFFYNNKWENLLSSLPYEPISALQNLLSEMGVKNEQTTALFESIFAQLIGWHGFIKWLQSRRDNSLVEQNATLVETVLIWCCYIHIEGIYKNFSLNNSNNYKPGSKNDIYSDYIDKSLLIWQRAYELTYEEALLKEINEASPTQKTPIAQFVFCIDVRSEAIRRHLEAVNAYETFGYAGFFGSIFSLKDTSKKTCSLQAPALVEPKVTVHQKVATPLLNQFISHLSTMVNRAKNNPFSTFAFFEIVGTWMLVRLIKQSLFAKFLDINMKKNTQHSNPFLSTENITNTAESMASFLKTIGLTRSFSPIVVICGHQARTTNNPFQATFDCGACGGNSGNINAKITCEILNNNKIRCLLHRQGIEIPNETIFISACHETTTDELLLENGVFDSNIHIEKIKNDIQIALKNLREERKTALPGNFTDRAFHFAELIPEWGLARNAAMIIGPRNLTESINLDGRAFLHSYDSTLDEDATILEQIITAPVIVAHWINSLYYFSSTDPELYGAGNKAIHNVVSKIGVIEGNDGDLKIGLPQQSLFFQNKRIHEPLKLLIVIFATENQINLVFKRQPKIKSLIDNGWLNLRIISPQEAAHVPG